MATAESQRRYRAAVKARGGKPSRGKSGKSGKKSSRFDNGNFVAIDGEGFNAGETFSIFVGENNKEYKMRRHEYAFLSASDGSEIYNPIGRLTAKQCLDFILEISERDPRAIIVCFGGSYDFTHMLAFDLTRDEIDALLHAEGLGSRKYVDVTLSDENGAHDYRIEMRPRKSLSIWRWPAGAEKYEQHQKRTGGTVWKMSRHSKACVWDVWGFFQGTFAGAMSQWLQGDADYDFILKMKGERSIFDRSEIDTIRRYNAAELRCLVSMMDKVREGVRALGLQITRWDGAGAIAGAMLRANSIKDHMAPSPKPVFDAACRAYSGGHIEACKVGHFMGDVYHYDINSAYPAEYLNLPSLAMGTWENGFDAPPDGFTLVRVEYRFFPGAPFYPLFYREENGTIIYPERGAGWYWKNEYDAACAFIEKFGCIEFRALEYWHFRSYSNSRPFQFVADAYTRRQEIVAVSKQTGIPNGEEKTIKLGLNSLYGKTAQQVGARMDHGKLVLPPYFQIEYAGWITAGCRAKLMHAALQNPDAIISFATDGIFSLEPLDLPCPKEKILGQWEYKKHAGITIVMPGVYWLHDDDKSENFSRGFDKRVMREHDFILQAWRKKQGMIEIPTARMVTLGTALMSDNFWEMRGLFVETTRILRLDGNSSKRYPLALHDKKLHKGLFSTHPRDLWEDYEMPLSALYSEPYPIVWQKFEDERENAETAEINDADRSFFFDREALILA